MRDIFGDLAAHALREQRRGQVMGIMNDSSQHVWAALADAGLQESIDYSEHRSLPDYHEDFMSHDDDYYSSQQGPGWWDEQKDYERTARARRAGDVFDDCAADQKHDAELNCAKEPARLPDGSYAESEAECLRLWAEGTPGAREGVTKTGTERQAGWNIQAEIGGSSGDKGGVQGGVGGGYGRSATHHDPTTTREVDRPGFDGYNRTCMAESRAWFNRERAKAMAHWAE